MLCTVKFSEVTRLEIYLQNVLMNCLSTQPSLGKGKCIVKHLNIAKNKFLMSQMISGIFFSFVWISG